MNYADYYDCDICNGNSVGMSLFVSGCPIHCQGCFNQETWDFNYGKKWTPEVENKFIELVGREYIKRVSILGGSPLCDENVEEVYYLVRRLRTEYPDKQIWVYTGYTWESIYSPVYFSKVAVMQPTVSDYRNAVLENIDVLVDGSFEYGKRDLTLPFRGSTNQRIIDVNKTLQSDKIVLWENPV